MITANTQNECLFAQGDRVQERYGWPQHGRDGIGGQESAAVKRLGTVDSVTRRPPNGKGERGWSIAVRWDGNSYVERGYTGATLVRLFVLPPVCLPGVLTSVAVILALLISAAPVSAQPRPVNQWADWTSYPTAVANPAAAAVAAWRGEHRGCDLGRLALSEGLGNGITLWGKRTYDSPRPCLGCAPDGFPSGHTMNSAIGMTRAAWGLDLPAWQRWALSLSLVAATGWLRHDANRHTWRQIGAGALLGAGADAAGQLIRCGG